MPLAILHRVIALIAGQTLVYLCDETRCLGDLLDRQDAYVLAVFIYMGIYELIVMGIKKWLNSLR